MSAISRRGLFQAAGSIVAGAALRGPLAELAPTVSYTNLSARAAQLQGVYANVINDLTLVAAIRSMTLETAYGLVLEPRLSGTPTARAFQPVRFGYEKMQTVAQMSGNVSKYAP